jgi:hypothetical protein
MSPKAGTPCVKKDPASVTDAQEAHTSDPVEVSEYKAKARQREALKNENVKVVPAKSSPEEEKEPDERHWIEVELVDDENKLVADEPFLIEYQDGQTVSGRTGPDGKARVEGLPAAGQAKISFPRIDSDEYKEG